MPYESFHTKTKKAGTVQSPSLLIIIKNNLLNLASCAQLYFFNLYFSKIHSHAFVISAPSQLHNGGIFFSSVL